MAGYDKTKLQLWKVRRDRRLFDEELTPAIKDRLLKKQEQTWAEAMKGQRFGKA